MAILGGIAAVVLGIGSYFVFNAMSGPDVPVLSDGDTRKMTSILRRVNASIDDQELDTALGRLQDAREISPDHPEVLSTAEALAAQYELDAMDLLEEDKLEEALVAIQKGLEAYPDFEGLIIVQEDVTAEFTERENRRIVAEALQLATDYESQGALIEPEGANAREEYARVITIDKFNQTAVAGLSSIESAMAAEIRSIVESGDFDAARQRLDTALAFFQTSPVLNDMRQGIAEAQRAENEQKMIAQFLADAEKSMNEDRLIEPESDSALYYYREVLNLNPNSEDARLGLDKIAAKYLGDGNKALADGDFRLALQLAGYGLRAQQNNAELLSVQRTATSELGEVEQQYQNNLKRATRIVQAVRAATTTEIQTTDGVFENAGVALLEAKSGFEEVLSLQADNADATRGLTTLSTVLYNDVLKLQRNGEIEPAKAALASASSITANEERFATLSASLDEQIQQRDIAERSRELVRLAESAIAVRPMTDESIDLAAAAVANVRTEFPDDANLSKLVSDLAGAVAQEARAVSAQGSDAAGLLMVNQALDHFAGNSLLTSAKADIERARRQREEAERQRIAAISGQLAIDATPWGVITEIRDQDGTVVELGRDTQTPFVKTLVEGSYTILIRSDSGEESTQQVTVVRQQLALARADFGLISADEYFERSAW